MAVRVGIIGLHYVDNIGGVLLIHALQKIIDGLGYESFIIDYDPTPNQPRGRFLAQTLRRRVVAIPRYARHAPYYLDLLSKRRAPLLPPRHEHHSSGKRNERFRDFQRNNLCLSSEHYTSSVSLKADPPVYDAYVSASDQIWNPFMFKKGDEPSFDPAYFLDFAPSERRLSYGPSVAVPAIPEHLRGEMQYFLNGIQYLSSRESQGARIIQELTGRDVAVVLDPTLLLDGVQWKRLAIPVSVNGPYMLCYFLGEGDWYRQISIEISRVTGLRLVVISRKMRDLVGAHAVNWSDAGPAEFLSLVAGASLVCTDSYHATLFSINFARPFVVFERPGSAGPESMATRIYSILELLGLESRLVRHGDSTPLNPCEIDYSEAQNRLNEARSRSTGYLKRALEQALRSVSTDE